MRVVIVVDGAVDLPAELAAAPDVRSVPAAVYVDDQPFDGSTDEFWRAVRGGRSVTTTAPTVSALVDAFAADEAVVAVHVSGELSLTVARAREAAERRGGALVVVDSGSLSVGAGLVAVEAGRQLARSEGFADVARAARQLPDRLHTFAVVADPSRLVRSGRAGIVAHQVSTHRPVVLAVRGRALLLGQPKDRARAIGDVARRVQDHLRAPEAHWAVGHGDASDVDRAVAVMAEAFGTPPDFVVPVDPTVGSHLGAEALVVAVLR